MEDKHVIAAREVAEALAFLISIGVWASNGFEFSFSYLLGILFVWLVLKNILVSIAALIFN